MESGETLAADPPPVGPGRGQTEGAAPRSPSRVSADGVVVEEERPFEVGDLVWAEVQVQARGPRWWPAKVFFLERGVLYVRFFGRGMGDEKPRRTPAQLRRFVAEFERMEAHSRSEGFLGAVREVLRELAARLDERLRCYSSGRQGAHLDECAGLLAGEFQAGQFVERLHGVAVDALAVNSLEATLLASWAKALHRSRRVEGSDREAIVVEDLSEEGDVPDEEERKNIVEAEGLAVGGGILRRPLVVDESNPRKQRSIAELIGCQATEDAKLVDEGQKKALDIDEKNELVLSSLVKRKKSGSEQIEDAPVVAEVVMSQHKQDNGDGRNRRRVSDAKDVAVVAEDVVGSGRRERKRSKYLLPPFTDISQYAKLDMSRFGKCMPLGKHQGISLSQKDPESPQAAEATLTPELGYTKEIRRKEGDVAKVRHADGGTSFEVDEILNELRNCAADHLHLKRSRSSKVVRNFFKNFRTSVYIESPSFKDHHEVAEGKQSVEQSSREIKSRKDKSFLNVKKARNDDADSGEKPNEHSNDIASVPLPKRRSMRKEKPSTKAHLMVDLNVVNGQEEPASGRKRRRDKFDAADKTAIALQDEAVMSSKESSPSQKRTRSKALENGSSVPLKSHNTSVQHELTFLEKKGKNSTSGETVTGLGIKHDNDSKAASQKKNRNDGANGGDMRTIMLIFTPDCSMPSKDELLSTFAKFGSVVPSRSKLVKDSHSARVVFLQAADARRAVESMEGMVISGASVAKYELQSSSKTTPRTPKLTVSKTPLPYIKKSLEKMISKLVESPAPDKGTTGRSKRLSADLAADLANEMEGVLQKVNKILTEPSASTVV